MHIERKQGVNIDLNNFNPSFSSEPSYDAEFQHFLRSKEIVLTGMSLPKVKGLTTEQSEAMVRLSRLQAFNDLVEKVEADEVSIEKYWQSVIIKQKLHMDRLVFISIPLNTKRISNHYCFVFFSNSSCGLRATLQSCLFLICGQRRSSPVSILINDA